MTDRETFKWVQCQIEAKGSDWRRSDRKNASANARQRANTNHRGREDGARTSKRESVCEIKEAEGSAWERGNSQPFWDERNLAISSMINMCLGQRPTSCSALLIWAWLHRSRNNNTQTPHTPFWQRQRKCDRWVASDTGCATLQPVSEISQLLFISCSPVLLSFLSMPALPHLQLSRAPWEPKRRRERSSKCVGLDSDTHRKQFIEQFECSCAIWW